MITYLTGSATEPVGDGNKIIAHVCNDIGGWGRGFVLSVSQRWPEPELVYRRWYQDQENALLDPERSSETIGFPLTLGHVVLVRVEERAGSVTYIANMIGQSGVITKDGVPPIRYDALERCLEHVKQCARVLNASVHMPRIGCGLAGGRWTEVERIILHTLVDVPVYVYDFNTGDARTVPWKP